jgi:hypothetical protein
MVSGTLYVDDQPSLGYPARVAAAQTYDLQRVGKDT